MGGGTASVLTGFGTRASHQRVRTPSVNLRRAVRAVVLDDAKVSPEEARVLLCRLVLADADDLVMWVTPGASSRTRNTVMAAFPRSPLGGGPEKPPDAERHHTAPGGFPPGRHHPRATDDGRSGEIAVTSQSIAPQPARRYGTVTAAVPGPPRRATACLGPRNLASGGPGPRTGRHQPLDARGRDAARGRRSACSSRRRGRGRWCSLARPARLGQGPACHCGSGPGLCLRPVQR